MTKPLRLREAGADDVISCPCLSVGKFCVPQHRGLSPALPSFKGRMMQSSQRGEDKEGRQQTQTSRWFIETHGSAVFLGKGHEPPPVSRCDSCALVRGPRAGQAVRRLGQFVFHTPPSRSLSTCSVPGAVLHQRWMSAWGLGRGGLSQPPQTFTDPAAADRSLIYLRKEGK